MTRSRPLLLVLVLLLPTAALADDWIPYTDGRAGGCFQNRTRVLYGCTPQPASPAQVIARDQSNIAIQRLEQENKELRGERNASLARQRSADNQAFRLDSIQAERRREAVAAQGVIAARQSSEYWRKLGAERMAEERKWIATRTGCSSQAYTNLLKAQKIKPHPSYAGICVPTDPKAGTISALACPPCSAAP